MIKTKHIWHNNFKKLLILAVLVLSCVQLKAQQDPIYSQYMNNLMSVNPAYTAVRGVGSISTITRKQWLNLNGSPLTSSLTLALPLDSIRIGGGFDFLYDEIGPVATIALFMNYSYQIQATANTKLSFGLKAGFNYLEARLTELDRYDYDDFYIIKNGDFNRFMPNFGVGAFWYGDNYYAGIAVPRLLQNKYIKDDVSTEAASREERHYFLHGAYIFNLSPGITFKPGITTIMTAGAPVTADFDFSFLFYDRIWLGAMYRISDAIGAYAQFQVENIKIGFSYDYTHTRLSEFNNGTFEIMLRYDFKTKDTQVFPFLGF